ncbi:MAG: hypothetical protein Q8L71_07880 [Thiobacillus sp.]|nr:hypothetical protein [Thiobacillus sp.]
MISTPCRLAATVSLGNSRVYALKNKYAWNKEFIMPAYPNSPSALTASSRQKGALGIFQLLGLGLLLLFVVFVLMVVIRGLFT